MSGDNTSPSPWMSRVSRGRGQGRLSAAAKGGLHSSTSMVVPEGSDAAENPTEETRIIKMPYLRFLDPAHQRVKF